MKFLILLSFAFLSITLIPSCSDEDQTTAEIVAGRLNSKPELPVDVCTRDSYWFGGKVLILINTSNETLNIELKVKNPNGESKVVYVVLEPNEKRELGVLEMNWHFEPGEVVILKSDNYKSKGWRITV